jgi:hypothetical protein
VAPIDPRGKARVSHAVGMVANLDNVQFFEKDTPFGYLISIWLNCEELATITS